MADAWWGMDLGAVELLARRLDDVSRTAALVAGVARLHGGDDPAVAEALLALHLADVEADAVRVGLVTRAALLAHVGAVPGVPRLDLGTAAAAGIAWSPLLGDDHVVAGADDRPLVDAARRALLDLAGAPGGSLRTDGLGATDLDPAGLSRLLAVALASTDGAAWLVGWTRRDRPTAPVTRWEVDVLGVLELVARDAGTPPAALHQLLRVVADDRGPLGDGRSRLRPARRLREATLARVVATPEAALLAAADARLRPRLLADARLDAASVAALLAVGLDHAHVARPDDHVALTSAVLADLANVPVRSPHAAALVVAALVEHPDAVAFALAPAEASAADLGPVPRPRLLAVPHAAPDADWPAPGGDPDARPDPAWTVPEAPEPPFGTPLDDTALVALVERVASDATIGGALAVLLVDASDREDVAPATRHELLRAAGLAAATWDRDHPDADVVDTVGDVATAGGALASLAPAAVGLAPVATALSLLGGVALVARTRSDEPDPALTDVLDGLVADQGVRRLLAETNHGRAEPCVVDVATLAAERPEAVDEVLAGDLASYRAGVMAVQRRGLDREARDRVIARHRRAVGG